MAAAWPITAISQVQMECACRTAGLLVYDLKHHTVLTSDSTQAEQYIKAHKDLSASHNCYAYKLSQEQRASDDGEPSGTAGQPILTAISAEGLNGVCVLVTRCRYLLIPWTWKCFVLLRHDKTSPCFQILLATSGAVMAYCIASVTIAQGNTLISPLPEAVLDCGMLLQTLWRNKAGYWWTGKGIWGCCKRVPTSCRESDLSASSHYVHAGEAYAYMTSCLQAYSASRLT